MMKKFNHLFLAALLAGGIAGLFLAGIQQFTIVPMILEAESYETAGGHEGHSEVLVEAQEGEEAWGPEEGVERTFYTAMNVIFVGIGFGLLLTACYALRHALRRSVTWRSGMLWGLAGFSVFHLAPALGLPPELPGDVAAGVEVRQVWWLLTAIATATGLWLIAFQPARYVKLAGAVLIMLPHLFGAPQPEVHGGLAPDDLRSMFIVTSLISNAAFWIVLGSLSAYFFNRIGSEG